MRVLISGAGIAGPTLAWWLLRYGFEVIIVEKAPCLRSGGYIIDFWGAGFDIAERMGLLPELDAKAYRVREVRIVGRDGNKTAGFPVSVVEGATQGRFLSLPRGELSASIFKKIEGKCEVIFGDAVIRVEQDAGKVRVAFERGAERDFDLVVGADGLHSRIRDLVFGAERDFETYLGYKAAAFALDGYRPRDELVYVLYTEVGQQVARFAMRDDRTMFLFTFADNDRGGAAANDVRAQKALLRSRFGNSSWECRKILDQMDSAPELYFDRVSQIRMHPNRGSWTRGRVTLLGDAAFCVSLLAGQGSALAMVAAYILAGELQRADGDYATAFSKYQELFHPFVRGKQQAALRMGNYFAPKSKFALFLRNQAVNFLRIPWIANFASRRDLMDKLTLPEY